MLHLEPPQIGSSSKRPIYNTSHYQGTNLILYSFMVVEITPIGIQSLQWRFYIIWTIFNLSFVPLIYVFYPETAARSLEDIDRLFRENHDILIFRHKDAISPRRPAAYEEHERTEMRRNSSVYAAALRRMSRISVPMQRPIREDEKEENGLGTSKGIENV